MQATKKISHCFRTVNLVSEECKETPDTWCDKLQSRLMARPCKALPTVIAAEAIVDEEVLNALLSFVYHSDAPLRWRAAWALEKMAVQCPSLLIGERSRMKALSMQVDTPDGLRRLLLGILYRLPESEELDVAFFNFLLDKMLDLQVAPGVQALAVKLAYRQSKLDGDLHKEFFCIVHNMELDYYPAAVKSVIHNCTKAKKRKSS